MAAKLHTSPPVMSPRYSREPSMLSVRCASRPQMQGRYASDPPCTSRTRTPDHWPGRRTSRSGIRSAQPEAGVLGAVHRGAGAGLSGVDGDGEHLAGQLLAVLAQRLGHRAVGGPPQLDPVADLQAGRLAGLLDQPDRLAGAAGPLQLRR